MRSRLLQNDYGTGWKHKVEKPISNRTKMRLTAACLLGAHHPVAEKKSILDQSLVGYAVIFFSLGYLLNL